MAIWLAGASSVWSQSVDPVGEGDEIEFYWLSRWNSGTVVDYADGVATVAHEFGGQQRTDRFKLDQMRFPDRQGHWMLWSDASGKFKIEARYISRTDTHVTLRRRDGSDVTVPIDQLNTRLRNEVNKTPVTGKENVIDGAVPVRVGDQIQINSWNQWYDATVIAVTREGAVVKYERDGFGTKTEEFKFADMRFPNGEGPWREWSDESGDFKIIARYISRDETHVTIRREDGSELRVEIAKLSSELQKQLRQTPIMTQRPKRTEFRIPADVFKRKTLDGGESLQSVSIPVGTIQPEHRVTLTDGGTAFHLEQGDSVSLVQPIGGEEGWIAVGTHGSRHDPGPCQLFWVSPKSNRSEEGPKLLPEERIIAFSPAQSRMVTVEVQGTWNTPVRLSSYRIRVGDTKAVPEWTWDVPELPFASSGGRVQVKLVGRDRLLMGYGKSVSLWNLSSKEVEYAVNGLDRATFWVSPDHRHFAVFDTNQSISLHDIVTGRRVARDKWDAFGWSTANFSQDGRTLMVANPTGFIAWSLPETKPAVELPRGGVWVQNDAPMSLLKGGWIVVGPQFYSIGLKLIVWRYDPRGVGIKHQSMVDRQMLAVAMNGFPRKPKTVLVGSASVPHKDAIELMKQINTDELMMLKRGARIRIVPSGDGRIDGALRRAAQVNGWIEDSSAAAVLKGSAGPGKPETRTYRVTRFGPGGGGPSEESHTVTPWIQSVSITYEDQSAWQTSMGGVPFMVMASGDSSIGAELSKSGNPNYSLFENLTIPAEILYPKYQQGLGRTWITANGFVDEVK